MPATCAYQERPANGKITCGLVAKLYGIRPRIDAGLCERCDGTERNKWIAHFGRSPIAAVASPAGNHSQAVPSNKSKPSDVEAAFEASRAKAMEQYEWVRPRDKDGRNGVRAWKVPPCVFRGPVTYATLRGCCGGQRVEEEYWCGKTGADVLAMSCLRCPHRVEQSIAEVAGRPRAASGAAAPASQKVVLILSREDGWRHKERVVADALLAAGWRVESAVFDRSAPHHGVPAWIEKHGVKPLATISWEEHGRQFFNLRMKNYANWALDNGIAPCHVDLAYLDHTRTFILDFYGRDGWGLINLDWPSLSGAPVDWTKYPRLAEYVKAFQMRYAESAAMPPLPGLDPGYVVFWTQVSNHLSRLAGRWADFLPRLDAVLRNGGNRLVVKTGPMRPRNLPDNLRIIEHDKRNPHQNSQLIRYAKYHILTCSSVSNELILAGAPVMATGQTRFTGKGVFCEADDWGDFNMPPGINHEARNRYLRWWAENEVYPDGLPARLDYVIGRAMDYARRTQQAAPQTQPAPIVVREAKSEPCTTVTTVYVNDEFSEKAAMECLEAVRREFPDSQRIAAIDYAPPGVAERARDMGFELVTLSEGEPPRMNLLLRESIRRATAPVILTVECDVILSQGFGPQMRGLFAAFADKRVFAIEATTVDETGAPCYPVNDRLGKRRQPRPYGFVAGMRLVRDMMYPTFSVTAFRAADLLKVNWKNIPPLVWADKYMWWQVGRRRIAVIAPDLHARHYKKVSRRAAAGANAGQVLRGVEAVA